MTESTEDRHRRPRWDVVLRTWIENRFENWGRVSARKRWPIIGSMVVLALVLGVQLPRIEIDTSNESFLRADDPTRVVYSAFREQFGNDQLIIIMLRPPVIFDSGFISVLSEIHRTIEDEIPHIAEVTSLINVRETRGDGDELIVRELLEDLPVDGDTLQEIRERALANPLYQNYIFSQDQRSTSMIVKLVTHVDESDPDDVLGGFEDTGRAETLTLTGEQEAEAAAALTALLDRFRTDDLEIHLAGGPIAGARLAAEMLDNMLLFVGLSLAGVAVFLFALFRRASAVFLPLTVVSLSILSTFGAMALIGMPLGIPTQILPSFLLAVGVGGSVHLLVIFYRAYDSGRSREEALAHALQHSGLAIVMTALTTAGGLASFLTAAVQPVADLGIFAPLGIGLGLTYCMVLLPALLHVIPLKRLAPRAAGRPDRIERVLLWTGDRCVRYPKTVVAFMSAILLFAIVGITRLGFSYDPISWFPPDDPIRIATELVNAELGGSVSLEVLVDTGEENGLQEPSMLDRLDLLAEQSKGIEGGGNITVGKVTSIVDVSKEIHQALNENRADYYAIPDSRDLVAQELLLFENSGSDDLEQLVDIQFRRARLTMNLPYASPTDYQPFIAQVEALARETLGADVEVTMTGFVSLMTRSLSAVSTSLQRSYLIALAIITPLIYLIALAIITPLMFLVLGNLRTGMAAMVPNLAPIILTLGLMGWLGIALDTFTLLIGGIAIGLAVDDTIHFMHGFRKYYEELGDTPAAVRETLRTTGHALLVTSIVLSLSFFIYAFASLTNLVKFGLLTGVTIIFAFIADITLSPALMALSTRGDRRADRCPKEQRKV
ncbi:MAG: MMPL family transporter [Deltaproteobacteria bacterium]|nr:MMPL family transporter [Deltaproteobacteria bacterium]